ncbi:MAG: SDR family NAD(P)-dependent oxidoreductase, partial [Thermoplasmata archaeon]
MKSSGLSSARKGRLSATHDYRGRIALVLGASRGIGAETARAFGRAGARVVLASRDESALRGVADEIAAEGAEALVQPVDLASPASLVELGHRIEGSYGHLDCAFNNAGEGFRPTPLAEVPNEAFELVQRVSVLGTFLALKQEIPLMLKAGKGAIVNMSSTAGLSAFAGEAPYVAAKHAIL